MEKNEIIEIIKCTIADELHDLIIFGYDEVSSLADAKTITAQIKILEKIELLLCNNISNSI